MARGAAAARSCPPPAGPPSGRPETSSEGPGGVARACSAGPVHGFVNPQIRMAASPHIVGSRPRSPLRLAEEEVEGASSRRGEAGPEGAEVRLSPSRPETLCDDADDEWVLVCQKRSGTLPRRMKSKLLNVPRHERELSSLSTLFAAILFDVRAGQFCTVPQLTWASA